MSAIGNPLLSGRLPDAVQSPFKTCKSLALKPMHHSWFLEITLFGMSSFPYVFESPPGLNDCYLCSKFCPPPPGLTPATWAQRRCSRHVILTWPVPILVILVVWHLVTYRNLFELSECQVAKIPPSRGSRLHHVLWVDWNIRNQKANLHLQHNRIVVWYANWGWVGFLRGLSLVRPVHAREGRLRNSAEERLRADESQEFPPSLAGWSPKGP